MVLILGSVLGMRPDWIGPWHVARIGDPGRDYGVYYWRMFRHRDVGDERMRLAWPHPFRGA